MSEPGKTVFVSFAPPDTDAVQPIVAALRAAGIEVWFDPEAHRRGDESDPLIRRQIRACALFVPVISAQTQSLHEGYFRLEWHLAEQRSQLMTKNRAFIVPVCLDATLEPEALVPEAFLGPAWSRASSQGQLVEFVAQVQRLLAQPLSSSRSGSYGGTRRPFNPENPSIPDYTLIRQIGRGSYGDVWLARSVTGLYRAVKIVWRERFADAQPFDREFKGLTEFAAASVGESIQLALLHVGRDDASGFFYYVMELADDAGRGRSIDPDNYVPLTFSELRSRRGRVPANDCLTYAVELTRVLAGLHARGLVHRDIKPSNVIFVNGVPKLADIGLVSPAAHAHTFVGTEGFVPPEGPGSPGADVYALGKVLYELCTGLDRHEFPQLPSDLTGLTDHSVLLGLNEIILRACDPTPTERYRDGAALLADLQTLRAGRPVVKRSHWPLVLAALVVAALAPGLFIVWREKTPPPTTTVTNVEAPPDAPRARTPETAPALNPAEGTPVPGAIPSTDRAPLLVVMPLENLSPDLKDVSIHEHLHAELITHLARVPAVRVLTRSSAQRYASLRQPTAELTGLLGIGYSLHGKVRRTGDALRLELDLRDVRSASIVWTRTYDSTIGDLAVSLAMVAQDIRHSLVGGSHLPLGHLPGFTPRNFTAFDLYHRSRLAADIARDVAKHEVAIALAEEAFKADPTYAAAAMAISTGYIAAYRAERDQTARPRFAPGAKRWAETAARLAPGGAADRAWAYYYLYVEADSTRSIAAAENSVRAFPNDAESRWLLAVSYFRAGLLAETAAEHRRAISLDPFGTGSRQLELHALARLRRTAAWERAVAEHRTVTGMSPSADATAEQRYALSGELPSSLSQIGTANRIEWLWRSRKFEELAAHAEAELPKPKSGMVEIFTLKTRWAEALRRAGRTAEADALFVDALHVAEDIATRPTLFPWLNDLRLGRIHALLGQGDRAVAAALRAVETTSHETRLSERWDHQIKLAEVYAVIDRPRDCVPLLATLLQAPSGLTVPMLRTDPIWDNVRDDAGFQALLADPKNSAPL
jgi:serine/threonine protein kinase/tetratricopeptide (TPR) repeat protein